MSAARRHRRSVSRGWAEASLKASAEAQPVVVGSFGPYDVVMKGSAMYVLAKPVPGMPAELAEAIALRRQATLDGRCACGGRRHLGPVRPAHTGRVNFMHEEDCPASDRAIEEIAHRLGWEVAS